MQPDALFVNTSRAELVACGAAALDVFESKPLPPDSPLLHRENVLVTPHLGYVEQNSYELYFRVALQNLLDFSQGQPNNILNPQACNL